MAARRKVIKRGRKPGDANGWAYDLLGKPVPTRDAVVKAGDVFAFVNGELLPANDARTLTIGRDGDVFAFAPPRTFATAKDSGKVAQMSTRIGGQVRGGITRAKTDGTIAETVVTTWEAFDVSDELGAGAEVLVMTVAAPKATKPKAKSSK